MKQPIELQDYDVTTSKQPIELQDSLFDAFVSEQAVRYGKGTTGNESNDWRSDAQGPFAMHFNGPFGCLWSTEFGTLNGMPGRGSSAGCSAGFMMVAPGAYGDLVWDRDAKLACGTDPLLCRGQGQYEAAVGFFVFHLRCGCVVGNDSKTIFEELKKNESAFTQYFKGSDATVVKATGTLIRSDEKVIVEN